MQFCRRNQRNKYPRRKFRCLNKMRCGAPFRKSQNQKRATQCRVPKFDATPGAQHNVPFQRSIPTIHSNDPFQRSIPFPRSNDANPSKTRTWLHRQVSTHRKACQSINVDKLKYHRRREFGADAVFCTDRTNAAPLTIDSALPFDEHQIGDAQSQSRTHAPTSTNPSATTRTWLS